MSSSNHARQTNLVSCI